MVLVDAWKRVVLERFALFSGRAGRAEFWWFVLANFIVTFVLSILMRASWIFLILAVGYSLAVLIPSIAVGIRRLHDTNKSGWWLLISFVPFVGAIVLIIFYATQGDSGANSHGDPEPWPAG